MEHTVDPGTAIRFELPAVQVHALIQILSASHAPASAVLPILTSINSQIDAQLSKPREETKPRKGAKK